VRLAPAMFDSLFPSFQNWFSHRSIRWRASTWWPSDSLGSMQHSLLQILSVAHRDRLDVTPLVANLAEEHRGRYRRRLRRLALRLADGTPLVDALEQTPDVLKDEDVLAIRFASQIGTLGPMYDSLISDSAGIDNRTSTVRRQAFIYSFCTFCVLALAVLFLVSFILPTLEQIQEEFALPDTSPFFETFLGITNWFVRNAHLVLLSLVAVAFLVWSAPSRRFFRRSIGGRRLHGVTPARSGQLMQLLANAVQAGRPLPAAISTLARYHFDRNVRQKLLFARNEIEHGTDVWTSLVDAKLLSPQESNAIAHAANSETRAWTLDELAKSKLNQVSRQVGRRSEFIQPALTLTFAAAVLLVAGAMIGYLAQMIQSLARIV
jgi:type II secretory pathway component PulF